MANLSGIEYAELVADGLEGRLNSIHSAADMNNLATVGRELVAAQKMLAELRKECGLTAPRSERILAQALAPDSNDQRHSAEQ